MAIQILLVDDNPDFLESCQLVWNQKEDIEVTTETDPEKALSKIEKEDYGVVVSDYKMSDINGLELLKTVREKKDKETPFVLMTGKGDEDVAKKALDFDADKYLKKGKNPREQLDEIIETVFERPIS